MTGMSSERCVFCMNRNINISHLVSYQPRPSKDLPEDERAVLRPSPRRLLLLTYHID